MLDVDRRSLADWIQDPTTPGHFLHVVQRVRDHWKMTERGIQETYATLPVLSLENERTIGLLRENFNFKENRLNTGIVWEEVEMKLRRNPEKLLVLTRLIERGGEPTVTAKLPNGKFRFDELSDESPRGHRDVTACQAKQIATQLGVNLMSPWIYDSFRGKLQLDSTTWSWLNTDENTQEPDYAYNGHQGYACRQIDRHDPLTGLRCSVEV